MHNDLPDLACIIDATSSLLLFTSFSFYAAIMAWLLLPSSTNLKQPWCSDVAIAETIVM
jgi:hypothetical protein